MDQNGCPTTVVATSEALKIEAAIRGVLPVANARPATVITVPFTRTAVVASMGMFKGSVIFSRAGSALSIRACGLRSASMPSLMKIEASSGRAMRRRDMYLLLLRLSNICEANGKLLLLLPSEGRELKRVLSLLKLM